MNESQKEQDWTDKTALSLEPSLHVNDSLFRNAFDYAAIGMALIDLNGRWLKVNRSLCGIIGYSEQELLSTDYQSLTHPDDLELNLEHNRRLLSGDWVSFQMEKRFFHKTGKVIWILLHVSLVRSPQGQPLYTIAQIQDISSRKQLEQKYKSLIEYNPAGICSLDMEGRIDGLNPAMEKIIGYEAFELLHTSFKSIIAGEKDQLHIFQNGTDGEQLNTEIALTHKMGHQVYLGAKDVPIIVDGRIVGFYIIARDITELKKTKESLAVLQQDLQDVVRKQQGMTFKFKRIDGRFIHTLCDGELVFRLGLTPERVVGKELREFLPADIAEVKERYYERAWSGEEHVLYEGQINQITYISSLRPIKRDGQVVEVIASCIDITERKRAEEDLLRTKEMLESLITNTSDAIDVVDLQFNVLQVNHAFEKIYGFSGEEVVGKPIRIIPDDKKEETLQLMEQLLSGQEITDFETVRLHKNGTPLHISLTISPIKNAEGDTVAIAGISRDITERKKTEELLRKSDRLSVVGQLAAGLAHEIRNPLTSLKGFLQLMRERGPNQDHYYEIMSAELNRINFIVSEFLIIAKPQVIQYEMYSLNQLILTVIQLLEPEATMNNVRMAVKMTDDPIMIYCSEIQMKQVFINLLKNAIEAMQAGGEIRVEAYVERQRVHLRVVDNGAGIPHERLASLGEPFYTTKEKGTGLGLMMCFKIIEAHQGTIQINSQIHEGTEVDIALPLAAQQQGGREERWKNSIKAVPGRTPV
ncbi:PAS domain S-box protein [Paenibacillus doosanensis]|uniref:PAS domain S-box protein n=1 Tax=Paenibacillus doosanensis TaxID=1229154 RepID=UPI00217F73CB|nr:PAS domain S-box protein [Paenibacillus doosanensis]MCS7460422.1 PAS domain S-box protein [Paenibacillus doosanensis]